MNWYVKVVTEKIQMPTTSTAAPPEKMEAKPVEKVQNDGGSKVAKAVLKKIGTPKNLHSATAIHLFGDYYRVNIRTVDDSGFCPIARIADSFYLQSTEDGEIKAVYEGKNKIELTKKYQ